MGLPPEENGSNSNDPQPGDRVEILNAIAQSQSAARVYPLQASQGEFLLKVRVNTKGKINSTN